MSPIEPTRASDSPASTLHDPEENGAIRQAIERGEITSGRDAKWIGADLSGLDLSGWDLRGAELSRTRLVGTLLLGAQLQGATLFEADLTEADLSGARLDGANLEGARLLRAGLGTSHLENARLRLADLTGASLVGAHARGAHFEGACLERARLDRADLGECDLSRCSLRDAELTGVSVDGAEFSGSDLRSARLAGISGFRSAGWLGVDLRDVEFNGAYLCRNEILDQNYLEDYRKRSPLCGLVYHVWKATSDCGRSASRWAFCTTAVTLLFTLLYSWVGIDFGENETPLSPLYFSVVTITTLGYGDVLPVTQTAQIVVMAQVILGYMMLGGLISLFANKMAKRAA